MVSFKPINLRISISQNTKCEDLVGSLTHMYVAMTAYRDKITLHFQNSCCINE